MSNEIWKDVTGFEGKYQVSTHGRVKRLSYTKYPGTRRETVVPDTILKNTVGGGYVVACFNSKAYPVHRLMANAFLTPNDGDKFVIFKDGNKRNLHIDNLKWGTRRDVTFRAPKWEPSPKLIAHRAKIKREAELIVAGKVTPEDLGYFKPCMPSLSYPTMKLAEKMGYTWIPTEMPDDYVKKEIDLDE